MTSIIQNKNSIGLSNITKDKRRVKWSDEHGEKLNSIKFIYQNINERFLERKAKDYQTTYELANNFRLHINIGGCSGDWYVFQAKIDKLKEPDWSCIGRLWSNIYGRKRRFEEDDSIGDEQYDSIGDEQYDSVGIIKTDHDSEVSFEDLNLISDLEAFLDNQNADRYN